MSGAVNRLVKSLKMPHVQQCLPGFQIKFKHWTKPLAKTGIREAKFSFQNDDDDDNNDVYGDMKKLNLPCILVVSCWKNLRPMSEETIYSWFFSPKNIWKTQLHATFMNKQNCAKGIPNLPQNILTKHKLQDSTL